MSSSLKFCVKFERKAAFNVKCLQLWYIFYEAVWIEPRGIKRKHRKTLNNLTNFCGKKIVVLYIFLVKSSNLFFNIASGSWLGFFSEVTFCIQHSAFCKLHPPLLDLLALRGGWNSSFCEPCNVVLQLYHERLTSVKYESN